MDDEELKGLLPEAVEETLAEEPAAPDPAKVEEVADAPSVTAQESAAPPPPQRGEGGGAAHVPNSAMLDERDKRQRAEQQLRDLQSRQAPPPPLEPAEQLRAALYEQNLKVSRRFADRQYGAELTATVHDWAVKRCDADPIFNQQMRSSEDPYEAAMQAYNRERVLEVVKPGDLDAFRAWQAAQAAAGGATLQTADPAPAAPAQPIPRSLATASGNGGAGAPHIVVGEGEAFRAVIPR